MGSPPASDSEHVPGKIEDDKEGGSSFRCYLYDTEMVHKIAEAFLPGLATACVDNTTGDIFRTPGSVAADIRKEMIDYLIQRSETFMAEHIVLEGGSEGEVSDDPYDLISDLIDDFATSKRNLFGRVSGWLLSERREDNIDDFAQEMEISGFWPMERREVLAQTLLKNVDFKKIFHCQMKFKTKDELAEHVENCGYRSMSCVNEGCAAMFCANKMENHDLICPFKIISCEQNCSESIMRREMDRHCITVCPMNLVKCPFYAVGCQSTVPQCKLQEHCLEELSHHLMYILKSMYKEVSADDLRPRVKQIEQLCSRLVDAKDARSLTYQVKDIDAKLVRLEIGAKSEVNRGEKSNIEPAADATEETEKKVEEVEMKGKLEEEKTVMNSTGGLPEHAARSPEVEVSGMITGKEPETGLTSVSLEEAAGKVSKVKIIQNDKEEVELKAQKVEGVVNHDGKETSPSTGHFPVETEIKAPGVMHMSKDSEEATETMDTRGSVQETDETKGSEVRKSDQIDKPGTETKNSTTHVSEKAETEAPLIMVMDKVDKNGTQTENTMAYSSAQAEINVQMS